MASADVLSAVVVVSAMMEVVIMDVDSVVSSAVDGVDEVIGSSLATTMTVVVESDLDSVVATRVDSVVVRREVGDGLVLEIVDSVDDGSDEEPEGVIDVSETSDWVVTEIEVVEIPEVLVWSIDEV